MANLKARKTIYYLRAVKDGNPLDLENFVVKARVLLPTVADTEIGFSDNQIIRIQHYEQTPTGVFIHLVRYVPGETAPTLEPRANQAEDDEGQEDAPEGKEYKDGDSFLLISKHHVIFCGHGISNQKSTNYITSLFAKAHFDKELIKFSLKPSSNISKLALLQTQGVKAIQISSSAYDVALPKKDRSSWFLKMLGGVGDEMKALVEKDNNIVEQKALEDLIVDIEVRLDGNTRATLAAQEFIGNVAEEIIDDLSEVEGGFTIVTMDNQKISASNIRLQSNIDVTKWGRSLSHKETWRGLGIYLEQLKEHGLWEQ